MSEDSFAGGENSSESENKLLAPKRPRGQAKCYFLSLFCLSCIFLIGKIVFVHWKYEQMQGFIVNGLHTVRQTSETVSCY